jgi:hypothetical protein
VDLFSTDDSVAIAAAEAIRDGCRAEDLPAVLDRLAAPASVELTITLVEACASIGDAASLPALWKVLDEATDPELCEVAAGAIGWLELGETDANRLLTLSKDRRFSALAGELRKAAVKLDPALKWKKAPSPASREALEQALSEWAFAMDEEKGIPAADEITPQFAKWLCDEASRAVGLRTPADWAAAADCFEGENFHGLVAEARRRATK